MVYDQAASPAIRPQFQAVNGKGREQGLRGSPKLLTTELSGLWPFLGSIPDE